MFFKKARSLSRLVPRRKWRQRYCPKAFRCRSTIFGDNGGKCLVNFDLSMADLDVGRAKWADVCRDLSMEPLDPLEMDGFTTNFDRGAVQRLAFIVVALERLAIQREILTRLLDGRLRTATKGGIVEPAQSSCLVTLELLAQSPLRREEFARWGNPGVWRVHTWGKTCGVTRCARKIGLQPIDGRIESCPTSASGAGELVTDATSQQLFYCREILYHLAHVRNSPVHAPACSAIDTWRDRSS